MKLSYQICSNWGNKVFPNHKYPRFFYFILFIYLKHFYPPAILAVVFMKFREKKNKNNEEFIPN